jgi:hypothetical protein
MISCLLAPEEDSVRHRIAPSPSAAIDARIEDELVRPSVTRGPAADVRLSRLTLIRRHWATPKTKVLVCSLQFCVSSLRRDQANLLCNIKRWFDEDWANFLKGDAVVVLQGI